MDATCSPYFVSSHYRQCLFLSPHLQIADREAQHLQIVPKEGLWAFWESVVTAIIKRQRGPPRIKVVPPARLQSKLGDGRQPKKPRPKTSRLRPATARFIASKDQQGSAVHDNLAGPTSAFHFIRVSSFD